MKVTIMENLTKREELLFLIKNIDKEFRKDFERRLSEYGLTAQQGRVLFYINYSNMNDKQIRQCDIEKHFNLTKSTVSGLIDRMEKADLVYKKKDGPNQYIEISEKTKGIIMHVFNKRNEVLDKMLNGLNEEEVETVHQLLSKIYGNRDKGGDK